jgi:uncharacterized lipoprotein NlpE involved in copper resistance
MKKTIFALMLAVMPLVGATAQTYTNSYSKEVNRLAEKWAKKGEWRTKRAGKVLSDSGKWFGVLRE